MVDFPLRNGQLLSPYLIYIRRPHDYSDVDLRSLFHLGHYRLTSTVDMLAKHVIIADAGEWSLIADDSLYTLWHMASTRRAIETLGTRHDVFACAVGDSDRSFDFIYFRDGRLARKYVVASPHYSDQVVVENVGRRLPRESALLHKVQHENIDTLAALLGLRTEFKREELRIYRPEPAA
jgi:hypothetical protein